MLGELCGGSYNWGQCPHCQGRGQEPQEGLEVAAQEEGMKPAGASKSCKQTRSLQPITFLISITMASTTVLGT